MLTTEQARMRHFLSLDHVQQVEAIQRLDAAGYSTLAIAVATQLSVEQVRQVLRAEPEHHDSIGNSPWSVPR